MLISILSAAAVVASLGLIASLRNLKKRWRMTCELYVSSWDNAKRIEHLVTRLKPRLELVGVLSLSCEKPYHDAVALVEESQSHLDRVMPTLEEIKGLMGTNPDDVSYAYRVRIFELLTGVARRNLYGREVLVEGLQAIDRWATALLES